MPHKKITVLGSDVTFLRPASEFKVHSNAFDKLCENIYYSDCISIASETHFVFPVMKSFMLIYIKSCSRYSSFLVSW